MAVEYGQSAPGMVGLNNRKGGVIRNCFMLGS